MEKIYKYTSLKSAIKILESNAVALNNPQNYIDWIKKVRIPEEIMEEKKYEHSGKTMLCSWVTKLCPAKCSSCFFKSNMYKEDKVKEKYELSDKGVENLIKFVNESKWEEIRN